MEDSYAHLQRQNVQSVSGSIDDTYEQIRLSVQPTGKRQRSPTTTAAKVVQGMFGAVLLVAVVMAVVAMVQIAELKGQFRSLEQFQQTKQTELSQPPSTAVWTSTTPAIPIQTLATPATPVRTATTPATPVRTTAPPATTRSPSVTCKLPDNKPQIKSSCSVIYTCLPDAPSGIYTVYPGGRVPGRSVWCEMDIDGGGWTRVQHRQDGSVAFNRTWAEYQQGFGSPAGEFWLGNDDLHRLTAAQPSELRVDLWDWNGGHGYAKYSTFSVGNASTNYKLHVGGYNGTIGDSLASHNARPFSTKDRDNDGWSDGNCATKLGGGGWWYHSCGSSNLNGRYREGGVNDWQGLYWHHWWGHNGHYSYRATAMMVRPRN